MSENCDAIVIFPIYGQFGATQKPILFIYFISNLFIVDNFR